MKIRIGQRVHVAVALSPRGKIVLGERLVNARSESEVIDLGTEVVVERAMANELIVRRLNPNERNELGDYAAYPIDKIGLTSNDQSTPESFGSRAYAILYFVLPGVIVMAIAFMKYQTFSSAICGLIIGALAIPACIILHSIATSVFG